MKTIGRRVFLKEGFAGALGLAVASGAGLGSLNACSQETEQQLKKAVKAAKPAAKPAAAPKAEAAPAAN